MDIESKVWSLTNTGTKLHVFKDGVALCSKAVRERTGPGEGFDYCEAKQGPFRICTRCDVKFNAAIETTETPIPEPIETPACICPRLGPPAKYGHHVVCPLRNPTPKEEENSMSRREGPLTERQIAILNSLKSGYRHKEIAKELDVTVPVIRMEARVIVNKLEVSTMGQAVAIYATYRAYQEAARLIQADVAEFRANNNDSDDLVADVLSGLATVLRDRANRLVPS